MKCQEAEKLLLLQDSGEMAAKRANPLAAHLHDCDPCRKFQHALMEAHNSFQTLEEPSAKVMQDILREARLNAPEKKTARIFALRPALAMAASLLIGLGIFFTNFSPDKVGLELVVTETQLLSSSDQLVSVMYEGLSEDDLAFNFLMTYEGNGQG
jgi:predicted anti-sigma-YlaC factor YlaD